MTKIVESELRQDYPKLAKMGQLGQHLVLHFDVNKTLGATDKAGGKPEVSMVVQEMLAERYFIFFDYETMQPISYYHHVKRLFPGDKRDPEVRANRFRLLHNFVEDYSLSPFGETLRGESYSSAGE